jgi:two-component system, response regulator PdtaR
VRHQPVRQSITVGLDDLAARDPKGALMCIMVVDDEALVRIATATTLRDAGFTVIEASNTAEALDKFGDGLAFRGLVTDVEMPNGYVLAKHARATKDDFAVLVISGRARPQSNDLPLFGKFLSKPVHPTQLVRELREAIETMKNRLTI